MQAVIIGADILGNIPETLQRFGIRIQEHISGRNASHQRRPSALPKEADLVILFTDFLGHNVMRHYRQLAKEAGLPAIACRRSSTCLAQALSCRLPVTDSSEEKRDPCAYCPRRSH